MAVRFDASTDYLRREAANIIASNADTFTMCAWCKRKVDTGAYSTVLYADLQSDVGGAEVWLETESGGDRLDAYELAAPESAMTGVTLTIDTWFFVAYKRTNTARSLHYGTEAGGTLTKVSNTDSRTFTTDLDKFWIGNDPYTEPFNGEIAYVRLWASELSDAEIDAEWRSATPVTTANLRGDWRLAAAASATTDSSGNSLTLTAGGALTDGGANPTPPASATGQPTIKRFGGVPHVPTVNMYQGGKVW